jgi:integrase
MPGELVGAFLASRAGRRASLATLRWYGYQLGSLERAVLEVVPPDVPGIERWLAAAPSTEYARSRLVAAAAFYRWLGRKGLAERADVARAFGPTDDGERALLQAPRARPPLPRTLTRAELEAALRTASSRGARDRALVLLLVDTGVRVGEAAGIRLGDLRPGGVRVRGKTGDREVPCSSEVLGEMAALCGGERGARVFRPSTGRGWFTSGALSCHVGRLMRAAGIEPPHGGAHVFRHTFATEYLRAGGGLYRLQRILGHSEIRTTARYLHLVTEDLADEHRRFSPLRGLLGAGQLRLVETG